jgi:hypothetical protein
MRREAIPFAGRLVAEFAVIVLGVLVALAADRWNQNRVDLETAREYHTRLVAELVSDSLGLEERAAVARERAEAGEALRELIRSAPQPRDSIFRRIYTDCAAGSVMPDIGGATFSEMQNTGAMSLMSPALRSALYEYYAFRAGLERLVLESRAVSLEPLRRAFNRSGLRFRDITSEELAANLRRDPEIQDAAAGCISYHAGVQGPLIRNGWLRELSALLRVAREERPGGAS